MTKQQHPITPPPELMQEWWDDTHGAFYEFEAITIQAARWGADHELEACCELVPGLTNYLRAARRPQPEPEGPTDKELYEAWYASNGPRCFARAVLARWGTPNSAEIRRLLGEPAECPACGGQPAPSNIPCAVCGTERPKPPSLKEQALKALDDISIASFEQDAANTIRYALEQLDD